MGAADGVALGVADFLFRPGGGEPGCDGAAPLPLPFTECLAGVAAGCPSASGGTWAAADPAAAP